MMKQQWDKQRDCLENTKAYGPGLLAWAQVRVGRQLSVLQPPKLQSYSFPTSSPFLTANSNRPYSLSSLFQVISPVQIMEADLPRRWGDGGREFLVCFPSLLPPLFPSHISRVHLELREERS